MPTHTVCFKPGSQVRAEFRTLDVVIPGLGDFVTHLDAKLGEGDSLASAALSARREYPDDAWAFQWGDTEAEIGAQLALIDSVTFADEPLPSRLLFGDTDIEKLAIRMPSSRARHLRSFLSKCASGKSTLTEIRRDLDASMSRLLDGLLDQGILAIAPAVQPLAVPRVPGLTRLQHAGLLYRGRDVGVLVDPHVHSTFQPLGMAPSFSRVELEGLVDAIVISHSHDDHYYVGSLMMFPKDIPILVPKVPRATILCPNMASTLTALGFTRVIEVGWYDPPVVVGDLEIHALPFFGEQPLLNEAPRHPDLRNHGNTYVIRCESYTSWFLIDSGNEKDHGMAEVAHEVMRRFGGIDLLLSNLQEFGIGKTPTSGGGHWYLALTPDQMSRFRSLCSNVITLGPQGVAEVCRIAKARTFLPYAHFWGNVGRPVGYEPRLLESLRVALAGVGADTAVEPWGIGDTYLPCAR